ncbi:MAG: hypothetical protein K5866_09265 [Treponema sp.]|nr:hypothetical protein [Treponema sp.]
MAQFFFPQAQELKADNSETLHYLGYKKIDIPEEKISKLVEECSSQMQKILQPRACWETFDLKIEKINEEKTQISFADLSFESKDLGRNLKDCKKVTLLAATIGPQVDSLIRKNQILDPVKAAIFQACGSMFIEVLIDMLNKKIKEEGLSQGYTCKPRYSPGYGDLSLQIQKDFFRLLPCSKLGLTLMDTLIMAPEKSVTAFIGLKSTSGQGTLRSSP